MLTCSDAYWSMSCQPGIASLTVVSQSSVCPFSSAVPLSISSPTATAVNSFEFEAIATKD